MKFHKFQEIKERSNKINELYDSFTKITLSESYFNLNLDEDLINDDAIDLLNTNLNEAGKEEGGLWATIVGLVKLKGMGAKYQKAMVNDAAADMDYSRRLKAAKEGGGNTDSAKEANKAKKAALKDQIAAISDKMDVIGTTEWLKTRIKRIKLAARMEKNKILLKIASKEEAKELQIKMRDLNADLSTADNELHDYENESKDDIEKLLKEKKDEMANTISGIEDKLKDNQFKIDKLGSKDESKVFEDGDTTELIKLKTDRVKLYKELATNQEAFNNIEKDKEKHYNTEDTTDKINKIELSLKATGPDDKGATGPAATGPDDKGATGPAATGPAATGPAATGPADKTKDIEAAELKLQNMKEAKTKAEKDLSDTKKADLEKAVATATTNVTNAETDLSKLKESIDFNSKLPRIRKDNENTTSKSLESTDKTLSFADFIKIKSK